MIPVFADKGAPEQIVVSGVLPVLALSLRSRRSQSLLTARLVSELANDCEYCICTIVLS